MTGPDVPSDRSSRRAPGERARHPARVRPGTATVLLVVAAALFSCEAMLPFAGRLIATAVGNYDPQYGKLVEDLTTALRTEPAAASSAAAGPMQLEVALLRQDEQDGRIVPVPMQNGDVLHWRGSLEESDKFKIFFRPDRDCFVYVVLVDSTGFVQVLHPAAGVGVPTRAGTGTFLPPGDLDLAYAVDQHRGLETIYFVASLQRRTDLEAVLRPFLGLERPPLQDPAGVQTLDESFVERGIAARSPAGVAEVRIDGRRSSFDTQAFSTAAGSDLVLTRWFDHR